MSLDSQAEEAMSAFESAIQRAPSVVRCELLSGSADYQVVVRARSLDDFTDIHRRELSALPRLARMETSFVLRTVVDARAPSTLWGR